MAGCNYTFWLDIGSWTTPAVGGGYVQGDPIFTGTSLQVKEEKQDIFARTFFGGSLQFLGGEARTLRILADTHEQIQMQVQLNGTVVYEGYLKVRQEYDEDKNTSANNVNTNDQYTILIDNKDVKVNVLGNSNTREVLVEYAFSALWFTAGQINPGDTLWLNVSPNTYAYERILYPPEIADILIGTSGWFLVSTLPNGYKFIARNWDDGDYPSINIVSSFLYKETSAGVITYSLNQQAVRGGELRTYVGQLFNPATPGYEYYWLSDDYYKSVNFTFDRYRRLDETIIYLIGQLDPSIQFDAQSFAYWNANPYLKNLMIGAASDMILTGTPPAQGSNPATIGNLTLQQLFSWLKSYPWQFYWTLEKIGSQFFFRLKHISEINKSLGSNPDYTNLLAVNWTEEKTAYTYQASDEYKRIHREYVADDFNFIGLDVVIPQIQTENTREISIQDFYFDLQDIYNNPSKYNADSNDFWVIVSTDPYTGSGADNVARIATGLITGADKVNAELSLANLDPVLGIFELPESPVLINNASTVVGLIKRRFMQQIEVPVHNPKDVNFEELFNADISENEGVSLTIPLNGQSAKHIGKF